MAGTYGCGQQGDSLLGELLAMLESLSRSQGHVHGTHLLSLFAVDDSPLGLVARL
jgi:hypothetical protein